MHIAYKCDICNNSFPTEAECDEHEKEHKLTKELAEKLDSKFDSGDIVRFRNAHKLYVIESKNIWKNPVTGIFEWRYTLYDNCELFGASDCDLELVVCADKVKNLVEDINEVLAKYNEKLVVEDEDISLDGHPVLELVNKRF